MRTIGTMVSVLAALSILVAGCSKSEESKGHKGSGATATAAVAAATAASSSSGTGGSTTCAAFNGYSKTQQEAAVTDMLKEEGKKVTKMEVATTRLSAVAFCKTSGKESSVIRQINTG